MPAQHGRNAVVVKRSTLLVGLTALFGLAGCKEPTQAPDSKTVSTNGFVRPGASIEVKEMRTYGTSDAVGASNDEYYVIRFKWTNDTGTPLLPKIDHFIIEDLDKRRFLGLETGNAALIGISNYAGVLQKDESHEYTVGFRVPQGTQGRLFYDASF